MKNLIQIACVVSALILFGSCNTKNKWELVWYDEFDYVGLPDDTKWNYDTIGNSYGWGNNELQFYTARNPQNAFVNGEHLNINALKERIGDFSYTSARLTTKEKGDWQYGKIEVRAIVPGGRGIWPAIWMLPTDWEYGGWPKSGEIDIMEYVGYEPDSIYTTVHTAAFNHTKGTQVGSATWTPNCEEEFQIYSIEWYPEKIDFFINKQKVFTFSNSGKGSEEWPFDKRFHLLLNVAVGGNWGGVHGVDDSIFPQTMKVDYVRVYQLKRNS